MTAEEKENKKSISAPEYIRTTFHSSDRLAVLVRNRSRGETIQRITTSARIVEPAFQEWMHFKNEKESCDIYVGMNTRYVVHLDRGEQLVAVRQNMDALGDAQKFEGRPVRLAWTPDHTFVLE